MTDKKPRWGFVIEYKRCIDCKACMVACKVENVVPPGSHRNWIGHAGPSGEFPNLGLKFEPGNCMHCENPPCMRVCPTGATYQREDGLVLVNYDKCIGCKYCMQACPYDARYVHTNGYVDKCTFCVHRLDHGQPPACVETCVGGSRHFGDLNDPESEASKMIAERDHYVAYEEAGTDPKIFYVS